jgi:formiminotetrahydrofolate cyclodeaminase
MIDTISSVIGTLISIITVLVGLIVYFIEKRKSYRKLLAQLKKEIQRNLSALQFSHYENIDQLNLDSQVFSKLVEGLNNEFASFCFFNDFKIPKSKNGNQKERKKTAQDSLRFIMDKIIELKQLSTYNEEYGPKVILRTRLNNLKEHLEKLKNILDGNPVEATQQ